MAFFKIQININMVSFTHNDLDYYYDSIEEFIKKEYVLVLSLKKCWFDVMITDEKDFECREDTKWIRDRLIDKKTGEAKRYDFVLFTNGYGYHMPLFISPYEGYGRNYDNTYQFSNGTTLTQKKENFILFLGNVLYKANINQQSNQTKLL